MPEVKMYSFSPKEIVEAIVKKENIHEGIWGLIVEFNFTAANAGPSPDSVLPSAIVGVKQIGIMKLDTPTNLSVDAAVVNPK